MADLRLVATTRAQRKKHSAQLRRDGQVPGVLYGHNVEPVALAADEKELLTIWRKAGRTHLVDLVIDSGRARKVLIKEFQIEPRKARPVHADFFAVNLKEKLTADIPVVTAGSAPAVDDLKIGQLLQPLTSLKVECLPQDLPAHLTADISGLSEIDSHVLVKDIVLPQGVTLLHGDVEEVVVKVAAMRVQAAEEEGEAAPEAATAEAPAAEAPAEAASE